MSLGKIGFQCWNECGYSSGQCNQFCGSGHFCCRQGLNEKGCDGKMGDPNHHVCVSKAEGKAVKEIIEPDDHLDLHF